MNGNNLLDVLTREGVLINVSVRYWRATKKLKPEDLGLDPTQVAERWKSQRRNTRWRITVELVRSNIKRSEEAQGESDLALFERWNDRGPLYGGHQSWLPREASSRAPERNRIRF